MLLKNVQKRASGLRRNTTDASSCANAPNGITESSIAVYVLIHINPESLNVAHKLLYTLKTRCTLISKQFNPIPVDIPYRSQENRLFRQDFAGEVWAQCPSLKIVGYGFVWIKDPIAPKDDTTWFLLEKKMLCPGLPCLW
jgi:hypothetical protein